MSPKSLPLLFSLFLLSSVVANAENKNFNSENVSKNLKDWIQNVEDIAFPTQYSDNEESSRWPCYTEADVNAVFEVAPAIKQITIQELEGQKTGRIMFNDKKTILEAKEFNRGLAQGSGKLTIRPNRRNVNEDFFYEGSFLNGCLEGRVRGFNFLPLFDDNDLPIPSNETVLAYIAALVRGFFYAESANKLSDAKDPKNFGASDLVFIYPDMKTALRGSFDDKGRIIEGQRVDIIGERTLDFGGIKELQFSESFGPIFKPDVTTSEHLSSDPMLRDPYESKVITVKPSSIPNAGEGVFVVSDVEKNTVVSYFNGIRLSKNNVFSWNPFRKTSAYLVELGDEKGDDIFLDIPEKYSDWKKYQASAGHKVNHSKNPNAAYTECQHPRFGKILCLYTLQDLKAGEELFTHYDISLDKAGIKNALHVALGVGQWYTGMPKKDFVNEVKPYLKMAANMADQLDVNHLLGFN